MAVAGGHRIGASASEGHLLHQSRVTGALRSRAHDGMFAFDQGLIRRESVVDFGFKQFGSIFFGKGNLMCFH